MRIEQARDTLATSGTTDPVFIALTSRITDLGRSIEGIAEARRDDLHSTIEAADSAAAAAPGARAPSSSPADPADLDTIPWVAERDSAESALAGLRSRNVWRLIATVLLQTLARSRLSGERPINSFSPLDMLGAALVVAGLVLGFGAALVAEFMRPRIADAREVELTR